MHMVAAFGYRYRMTLVGSAGPPHLVNTNECRHHFSPLIEVHGRQLSVRRSVSWSENPDH